MKFTTLKNFSLAQLLLVVAVIGLLAALALPATADPTTLTYPTGSPNTTVNLVTNSPQAVAASSTFIASTNSKPFALRMGKGFAVLPYQVCASASTATVIYNFDVSADGSSFTTTTELSVTNTLNGTTAVRDAVFIPPATLDNVRLVRLNNIVNNATNTVYVTNVVVSYSAQ